MTNDKTVTMSRELAERLALPPAGANGWTSWNTAVAYDAAKELRASSPPLSSSASRWRAEADGDCPHCEAELDLEDWPIREPSAEFLQSQAKVCDLNSELADLQATIARLTAEIERIIYQPEQWGEKRDQRNPHKKNSNEWQFWNDGFDSVSAL